VQDSALPSFDQLLAALREMHAVDVEPMFRILTDQVVFEHTSWNLASLDDLRGHGAQERTPGIACAACETLVRRAFEHVGLVLVQGTALVTHMPSQRVLEACAFEREGLLRNYRLVRGSPGDFWMCSRIS